MNSIRIAIDAMGGDLGPRLCVPASQKFARQYPQANLVLVGDQKSIQAEMNPALPQLEVVHSAVEVAMAEKPSSALRHKGESSMAVAISMVKQGRAQACVSAGNTGAMMAFGMRTLGVLEGVDRPAICKALPAKTGCCWVLDLGASVECDAEQFLQYAQMGAVVANHHGISLPRVALLNIGAEATKGRAVQQQAAPMMADGFGDQYVGFVEAGDVFRGLADVVVCDGFSGNVLLKASEGATEFLQRSLTELLHGSVYGRLLGWLAAPHLSHWRKEHNLDRYNGAILLGLSQVVIKSHGAASEDGFAAAIGVAQDFAQRRTLSDIADKFTKTKGGG